MRNCNRYGILMGMVNTNIDVRKNPNENNASLLRRFSRRVQEAGIMPKVKSLRYHERKPSKLVVKTGALKKLKRRKEYERMKKLGKVS